MRVRIAVELAVACVALAAAPLAARAQSEAPARASGSADGVALGAILQRYADRLGLDARTRAEVGSVVEESTRQGLELRQRLREASEEMRVLLAEEAPDEPAVMRQAEKLAAIQLAIDKNRLHALLRIRAQLTNEQRRELARLLAAGS